MESIFCFCFDITTCFFLRPTLFICASGTVLSLHSCKNRITAIRGNPHDALLGNNFSFLGPRFLYGHWLHEGSIMCAETCEAIAAVAMSQHILVCLALSVQSTEILYRFSDAPVALKKGCKYYIDKDLPSSSPIFS